MAAKDYVFKSDENGIYLTKQLKDPQALSQDKREVTDKEILGLFGCFLARYCEKNSTDTISVSANGKPLYVVKLVEKNETPENTKE